MFNEILQRIVDGTSGALGAILMGYDGIAIDQYFRDSEDLDLSLVAVEYSNVLKEIRRTAEILDTGAMEEVSVKTERLMVIIRTLNDEYFIALTLKCDGNFGKGRYLLMREAPRLREALA
jgi:predicted regulator of Ras-like GTPase activity (Roadblock/LC7/MglB family)